VETVAVYQEERVKVYGITEKTELALGIIRFPVNKTELWGQRIIDFETSVKRFELVTYHNSQKSFVQLHLLFDLKKSSALRDQIGVWTKGEQNTEFSVKQPVDVLYLFGPHFQDRFGIVDIAFDALLQSNIDILVSGCAGTSMYFVTSKNQGRVGLKILQDTFLIPTTI
jgi:aspartokinase